MSGLLFPKPDPHILRQAAIKAEEDKAWKASILDLSHPNCQRLLAETRRSESALAGYREAVQGLVATVNAIAIPECVPEAHKERLWQLKA